MQRCGCSPTLKLSSGDFRVSSSSLIATKMMALPGAAELQDRVGA